MQHDALQQRAVHGQDPQQDLSPLPAEEVQQDREVHHVSWQFFVSPPPGEKQKKNDACMSLQDLNFILENTFKEKSKTL